MARLWDTESRTSIAILRGHEGAIPYAAFSPDGTHVVTASEDGTARLWDATTGDGLAVLSGHEAQVWYAAFSPDGSRVVTASEDGTARIFNVFQTTQDLIDHARSIVPRALTPCERERFFLPVEGEVGDCPN